MKKTLRNSAVILLLSLGVSACSVSAGSGSQGEPITRTSSTNTANSSEETTSSSERVEETNATETASSEHSSEESESAESSSTESSSTENSSTESAVTDNTSGNVSSETETVKEETSNESVEETTSSESTSETGSSDTVSTAEETDSSQSTQNTEETTSNESNSDTTSSESSDENTSNDDVKEVKSVIAVIDGYGANGSYAANYLNNVEAQNALAEKSATMTNEVIGSCTAVGGNSASNHRCSVGSIEEGEIFAAYNVKNGNNQILGGYAVVREAYTERENPTNSYLAMISTPTTDKSVVVDATYTGQASYSSNNRPNMATYPFELTVSGDNVNGAIYNNAGTGKRVNRAVFNTGTINATDNAVNFNGTVTFNNYYFSGLGEIEGYYQGAFVGENAEGVVGTFGTKDQNSTASAQGAFAGTK